MINIEFEEPVRNTCDCCGGVTTTLTRFVYKDGDAFAVYYAAFTDNHPEREIKAAIGLGEWGDGSTPDERRAFALRIREGESQYEVVVEDSDESLWQEAKIIGRMLNRNEALADEWIKEVFHITDHMVEDDPEIKEYFGRKQGDV